MEAVEQIRAYLAEQPEPKRQEMQELHRRILAIAPHAALRYLDGKDADGKTVSNPNIGYGSQTIPYANGTTREFYQVGLSGNTSGISLYIMGLADKNLPRERFAATIGKASVTGYCIKFKSIAQIDLTVLEDAIRLGFESH